ncbi:MAG: succinyl-diaminopimelate desuccinylase [Alphaproteobacteria bacterium]
MTASVDPAALAVRLIQCPSVTPADAGALGVLQAVLEELGFRCERLPFGEGGERVDNLWARLGTGAPHFCFAGHTDVVPPGDEAQWAAPPFEGRIAEGVLHGRGAVDMKGAVAAFAAAVSRYLRGHGAPQGTISLLITGDEEGASINGTVRVLEVLRERGETPDHCLVGEPTNPESMGTTVKIGRRGSLGGWLIVRGKQGHVAYPERADNPIPRLAALIARLSDHVLDEGTEHFQPSNLEFSTVDVGNPAANVIPGEAHAIFNIRFNTEHTAASLEEWLRAQCTEFLGPESGWTLLTACSGEAFLTEPGDFTRLVADAVSDVTGQTPELSTTGGTSDARFIRAVCPVAEFGLVNRTMHRTDEQTPLTDLETLTRVYEAVLTRYFSR